MKKILLLLLANFLLLTGLTKTVLAISDPLREQNNKYGIHLADHNDISEAATLVNSSGGDWGYVTLVIQENDRDLGKWQNLFDQLRRLHLIPILRLATIPEKDYWLLPKIEEAQAWAVFLNQLNWPIENRYVVFFNEPNHAKEWGNSLNPEEYAEILAKYCQTFKEVSADFFLLPAGLDASAPNSGETMEESLFLRRMQQSKPEIFSLLDGWTSHSYPNPNFSGSPFARGKGTLTTYQWELAFLSSLGVNKQLPVFITETGWQHQYGTSWQANLLSPTAVGFNLLIVANIWSDHSIVAVTPFVFNYQSPPFDHFSWRMLGANSYYDHYYYFQNLPKPKGEPKQKQQFQLNKRLIPDELIADSVYTFTTAITNQGQAILNNQDYQLQIEGLENSEYLAEIIPRLEPGETGKLTVHLKTKNPVDVTYQLQLLLYNREKIVLEENQLKIAPPLDLTFALQLGWRKEVSTNEVKVLLYQDKQLLQKFTDQKIEANQLTVRGITNILPKETYRLVVIVPDYLPRQIIMPINLQNDRFNLKRFYPLDLNRDGTWNILDLLAAFKRSPSMIWKLFL